MDKRYLLILIIIIVCCVNLSIVVNNSEIIGSASAIVGKYIFSIPEGFSLYENNNAKSATIQNDDNITIYFESNLSDSDTYDNRLNYIENKTDDKILSEGTINIENISIDTVYFQTNNTYKAVFYFEKDNTQFKIVISDFNYDTDRNLTLDYAKFIIQSTRFDYKTG